MMLTAIYQHGNLVAHGTWQDSAIAALRQKNRYVIGETPTAASLLCTYTISQYQHFFCKWLMGWDTLGTSQGSLPLMDDHVSVYVIYNIYIYVQSLWGLELPCF